MQRLLVTVAFSALALGVATTGVHAQVGSGGGTSANPAMSSNKNSSATQSNQTTSSSSTGMSTRSGMSTSGSMAKPKSSAKTAKKDMMGSSGHSSSAADGSRTMSRNSQDHSADDLNRQSLSQMGGAPSYGSSGSMAPSNSMSGSSSGGTMAPSSGSTMPRR
jgi:hypothetical protein